MAVRPTALSFLSPAFRQRPADENPAARSDRTGPRARTGALLALSVVAGLAAGPPAAAAPGDCIEDGGEAICSGKQAGPWAYRLCDDTAGYLSRIAAWCHVLHEEAQWNGPYAIPMCAGTPIRLTETLLVPKAEAFTERIDKCTARGHFGGWLSPGERIDSWCWDGGPGYEDGLEIANLAEISVQCTDRDDGERIIAGRWRDLGCPMGYEGPDCARFAEATCGVGNPIQPGGGNKQLTERDLGPTAAGALALVRHYNSQGGYRPRGSGEVAAGGFGRHWRTAYDARLYPLEAFIVAHRPDGRIQYFDAAGNERLRYGGARERLEALGAAGEQGWRYTTREDTVERYDAAGRLRSITPRGGHTQTLLYDVPFAEGGDDNPETLDRVV